MIIVQGALDLQLFLKVGLKLSVDELHNRFVAAHRNEWRAMKLNLKA